MNGKTHPEEISDITAFIKRISSNNELRAERIRIEAAEKWGAICEHIPILQFPPLWKIKILPPYLGVIVRYQAEFKGIKVSVFLDFFERCGVNCEKEHTGFWEIMRVSTPESDIRRYQKDDTNGLIQGIQELLDEGATL